jgi:Domain of unknown function (DUF4436)
LSSNSKDGDINSYPFDVYTTQYFISAYTSPAANNTDYGAPLPLFVFVSGTVEGFVIDSSLTDISDAADASQMMIYFTVRRRTVVKVFAIIIFLGSHAILNENFEMRH